MTFTSEHDLFTPVTFTDPETDARMTGTISEVIASEVGPNAYGIFYTVDLADGSQWSVEECTMYGSKK